MNLVLVLAVASFNPGQAVVRCQAPGWMYSGIVIRSGDAPDTDLAEYVLTAKHCIQGATRSQVTVRFQNGQEVIGHPADWSGGWDGPALLKIPKKRYPTAVIAGRYVKANVDKVWALGYPQATFKLHYKVGFVTQGTRISGEWMSEFNRAQWPGYSGGPLYNEQGEILGVASCTDFRHTWHISHTDIARLCWKKGIKPVAAQRKPPADVIPAN